MVASVINSIKYDLRHLLNRVCEIVSTLLRI